MKHRWKRSGVMALVLFLCLLMVLPAFASESGSSETEQPYSTRYWRLSDATETISEADQKAFDERAMEAVTHYQFDFVFAIIPEEELGEDSLEEYTDWFYHENGFGYGKQQERVVCLIMANQDAQPNQCNVMGVGPLGEELFPTEKCETLRDVILQTVKAEGQLSKGYVEGADIFLRKTTWELRLHSASAQAKEIVDKTFPYANQEKPDWFPEDWAEFKCYYDPAAPQLTDAAGIFSGEEANTICEKLRALRKKYGTDFVVFTDRSTHGLSRGVYAADFFEATGHGLGEEFSGMILFICMEPGNRGWWTAAKGSVRPLFSKTNINRIDDRLEPYMKAGQYGTGVIHYLDDIDTLYSRGSMPRPMIETIFLFLPGLAAAIIAGLLVSSKMKDDMKTVRVAVNANAYLVRDSLQLRRVEDRFLYSTVTRTERSSSNDGGGSSDYSSNYSSSSGSSWSGGGRSF